MVPLGQKLREQLVESVRVAKEPSHLCLNILYRNGTSAIRTQDVEELCTDIRLLGIVLLDNVSFECSLRCSRGRTDNQLLAKLKGTAEDFRMSVCGLRKWVLTRKLDGFTSKSKDNSTVSVCDTRMGCLPG